MVAVAVILIVVGVLLLVGAWLVLGPGPRRKRAYKSAQNLIEEEKWQEALGILERLKSEGGLSDVWQERVSSSIGDCYHIAAEQCLRAKNYEDALGWALKAGPLLGVEEVEQRSWVVDSMLSEVRRLFSIASNDVETNAVTQLLTRLFQIQSPCPEASFWLGLCLLKQRQTKPAMEHLQVAYDQAGKKFLDPAFYLGMIQHRLGNHTEAIRLLSEANRVDSSCPFVTAHVGITLVSSGGDSGMALRALQKATGDRGLQLWSSTPEKAWVEAFPETHSYVRRLAQKHTFTCPILGRGLSTILRMATEAKAQAHYRLCQFQESAQLYGELLQNAAPTASVLRGLGLALCRLKRYDQAYKHLRTALEMEEGKDPLTAGYLALCGAMGKPTKEGDKAKNIAWAIKLLSRYQMPNNNEWANIYSEIFHEARTEGMKLAKDDQTALCNVLASVHAHDDRAADAYRHIASTFPKAVLPRYAWLYARAAAKNGYTSDQDVPLFALTFKDSASARQYFDRLEWNFEDVEFTFLERSAQQQPGRFPETLGPDYPSRGEEFLLTRSRTEEEAGEADKARAAVEILLKLSPSNVKAIDRLACLHHRGGEIDKAIELLDGWQKLEPSNHWPVIRRAILEQERGNAAARAEAIDRALGLTQGTDKANVAYLGAKLALRDCAGEWKGEADPEKMQTVRQTPISLLDTCLEADPTHVEAVCCLASVRARLGDVAGLEALSPFFSKPDAPEPRYHLLGSVSAIASRDYSAASERAQRCAKLARESDKPEDKALVPEAFYLLGLACLHTNRQEDAVKAFNVASKAESETGELARAFLGQVHYQQGSFDDAVASWKGIDPKQRKAKQLDAALQQLVFLAGLKSYENREFEQAADRFREAGQLGLREPRLGSLITLSLVRAGQRLLFGSE